MNLAHFAMPSRFCSLFKKVCLRHEDREDACDEDVEEVGCLLSNQLMNKTLNVTEAAKKLHE